MSDHRDRVEEENKKTGANRSGTPLVWNYWKGVAQSSAVASFFILIVCIVGLFGLGAFGFCPPASAVKNGRRAKVLAAGPLSSTSIFPLNFGRTKCTAPPEYCNVEFWKEQSSQSRPSNSCGPFMNPIRATNGARPRIFGCIPNPNAGAPEPLELIFISETLGMRGGGGVLDCAKVTVWIPKSSDPTTSPTIKDPNAKVILDISPPISGKAGNCSTLEFKYGEPPPQKVPRRKTKRIIRPKKTEKSI